LRKGQRPAAGMQTSRAAGTTDGSWCSRVIRRMSADVHDARLGLCLSWRLRLCRKLKHRCLLTLMQVRQENKRAIRKFECVVMHLWYVLVDLSKDRRSGAYCSPAKETGRRTYHLRGKGELRSGKNADRRCGILRRGKPTCTGDEVVGRKLVTTFAGRDLTLCRLKSHMAEELLSCERPANPNSIAENGPTSHHARLARDTCSTEPSSRGILLL
jgi:hypothetical protein